MPTLSFYDYAFLLTETADSPKHVAGVQIFRPPAGYAGDYVSDLIETLKERPVGSPFDFKLKGSLLSKPEWVRDDNFDLDYHLRRSRLPRPGSRHQLMELVGRLHSILLDRQRPLVPDLLEHHRKIGHCLVSQSVAGIVPDTVLGRIEACQHRDMCR